MWVSVVPISEAEVGVSGRVAKSETTDVERKCQWGRDWNRQAVRTQSKSEPYIRTATSWTPWPLPDMDPPLGCTHWLRSSATDQGIFYMTCSWWKGSNLYTLQLASISYVDNFVNFNIRNLKTSEFLSRASEPYYTQEEISVCQFCGYLCHINNWMQHKLITI
jgi:hypothetical protein